MDSRHEFDHTSHRTSHTPSQSKEPTILLLLNDQLVLRSLEEVHRRQHQTIHQVWKTKNLSFDSNGLRHKWTTSSKWKVSISLTLNRNTPAFLAFLEELKCFWTTLSIVISLAFSWSSPVIRDPRTKKNFQEDHRGLRIRSSLPGTLASDDKAERNQQSPNFLPWWMSLASRPSVNVQSEPRRPTWPSAFSFEKMSNSSSSNLCS